VLEAADTLEKDWSRKYNEKVNSMNREIQDTRDQM
jgi:hypothetical protein